MVDQHSYSFFGQTNGLIINSPSKEDPFIFFTCLKKKQDGSWEKPSSKEGKTIKMSLEEMVMILEVLKGKNSSWNTQHTYQNESTPISFSWDAKKEDKMWVTIGGYKKMLSFPQVEIFRMLLNHMLKEKIEFSTAPKNQNAVKNKKIQVPIKTEEFFEEEKKNDLIVVEQIKAEKEVSNVPAIITSETQKALLLLYNGGEEVWTPKSIIHSQYGPQEEGKQTFIIESWFLKKNNILR